MNCLVHSLGPRGRALLRPALAVLLVIAVHTAITRHGVMVTPDSVHYLSAAQQSAQGHGLRTVVTPLESFAVSAPLTPWPPLYPLVLGLGVRMGTDVFAAARWSNALFLVCAALAAGALAGRVGGSRVGSWAPAVYALLFFPFLLAAFAWSETLFLACTLGSLVALDTALRPGNHHARRFALAGMLAGLAMLTRYAGGLVIAAGAVSVLLMSAHLPRRDHVRNLLYFALPATLPNALWLIRNRMLTGHFFGDTRPEGWFTLPRMLGDTASTLLTDFLAPAARVPEWAPLAWILGLGGLGLLVLALRRALPDLRFPESGFRAGTGILLAVWALVYVAGALVFVSRVGLDPVNTRYLAPAYPALWILATAAVGAILSSERRRGRGKDRRRPAAWGVGLVLTGQVLAVILLNDRADRMERTLTAPYWSSSASVLVMEDSGLSRVRELAGDRPVLSNVWDQITLATGLPTKPLPGPGSRTLMRDLGRHPGSLIAVRDAARPERLGSHRLHAAADTTGTLEWLETTGDWTLFRVREVTHHATTR